MSQPLLMQYPAGSLLRASQICRDPKTGRPGILPWVRRTWLKKVASGEVGPGRKLGKKTRVWTIEEVLAVAATFGVAVEHREPEPLRKGRAILAAKRAAKAASAAQATRPEAVTDPAAIEAAFAADEEADAAPRSQRLEFAGPEPAEPAHQLRAALERLVAVCKAMDAEIDGPRPSDDEYRAALAAAEGLL